MVVTLGQRDDTWLPVVVARVKRANGHHNRYGQGILINCGPLVRWLVGRLVRGTCGYD